MTMHIRPRLGTLVLASLAVMALAPWQLHVAAAATPSPTPPGPVFGVHPSNEGDTTHSGGHFSYSLTSGAVASDSVVVQNFSDKTVEVDVYAADLLQASGGGFGPSSKGDPLHGVGQWIHVSRGHLTLPPHMQDTDTFTVAVPVGVTPADHSGAIVAEATVSQTAAGTIKARTALIVEVIIPGTAHPSASLSPLIQAPGDGKQLQFAINLTNTGNVLLTEKGAVVVRDANGKEVTRLKLSPADSYAIPNGTLNLKSDIWSDLPRSGDFTVQAEVPIFYDGKAAGTLYSNKISLHYVDWVLMGAEAGAGLVGLVLLGWFLFKMRRRQRRRNAERAEAEREKAKRKEVAERLRSLK